MTVSTTARKQQFVLDGTVGTLTFTFRALVSAPTDIKCIATVGGVDTTLAYTTNYSASINSDGVGGTVTLVSPATIGAGILTVYRETTNTQESDYDDYNQFPADTLETDIDKRTMVSQEAAETIARSMLLPISSTGSVDLALPAPESDKIIGWNTAADALENKDYVDLATVQASAAAAAASAAAASSFATDSSNSATTSTTQANNSTTQATLSLSYATIALNAAASIPTVDTDGTLALNSDSVIPSQKAVKTYVDTSVGGGSGSGSVESAETKLVLSCDGTDEGTTFTDDLGKTVTNTETYDSYTKLMLHLNNNVTDSATSKTVTNSNVTFSTTKKFGSHSASFNGTNSTLTIADSADWHFGTGDFTIDFWYRPAVFDEVNGHRLCGQSAGDAAAASRQSEVIITAAKKLTFTLYNNSATPLSSSTGTTVLAINTWYHIALVRNGVTATLYLNGTAEATLDLTGVTLQNATGKFGVGSLGEFAGDFANGLIDEFRISKGIARWTSNFTVPAYAYGQVVTSTAQQKFGTASGYFDGGGSYLSLADSADWDFGSGDFTIDCWVRPSAINELDNMTICDQTDAAGTSRFHLSIAADQKLWFRSLSASVAKAYYESPVYAWEVNTWYHIAIVRNGSNFYQFINGVSQSLTVTTAISTNTLPDIAGLFGIGARPQYGDGFFPGHIDELRVSKGIARWTSDFTPPTSEYLFVSSHVHNGNEITTGTVGTARLGSGSPSSANFLRGDGAWSAVTTSSTILYSTYFEVDGTACLQFDSKTGGAPIKANTTLTLSGLSDADLADGKVGYKCYTYANNKICSLAYDSNMNGSSELTIEAVVYCTNTADNPTIISLDTEDRIYIKMNTTTLTWRVWDSNDAYESGSAAHGLSGSGQNQWIYVVLVWDKNNGTSLYLNGSKLADGNLNCDNGYTLKLNSHAINIGVNYGGSEWFYGKIDGIRWLKRRMTATDILYRYNTFIA